jgi:hypothetical protein
MRSSTMSLGLVAGSVNYIHRRCRYSGPPRLDRKTCACVVELTGAESNQAAKRRKLLGIHRWTCRLWCGLPPDRERLVGRGRVWSLKESTHERPPP